MRSLAKELLVDLMHFYSVSGEELSISMFLYDILYEWGLPVRKELISRGSYNVIVNDYDSPTLVIASHIDTIKILSLPKVEDEYISGTGSVDAKASVVAMLLALKLIENLPKNVSFVFFSDEEDKGGGSEYYLIRHRPKYALVMEPTELKVCFAGYGALEGTIYVRGERMHPAISHKYPNRNTVFRSIDILSCLRKKFSEQNIPFTVFAMSCGSEDEYSTPELCQIHFDLGVPPGKRTRDLFKLLLRLSSELNFEFIVKEYSDPFETNDSYIHGVFSIAYERTFKHKIITSIMPSWTDANNLASYGSKPVVFGPGSLEVSHSYSEKIFLNEIVAASQFVMNLLFAFHEIHPP